jgi:hypothetical protein
MNTFNNEMFASIKDALTKEKSTSTLKDILRTEVDPKPYIVRLIPNIKDPDKTFFHYYNHGWESFATGQFVSAVSPTTWNERDPIAETRFKIAKTGSEEEKEKATALNRKENWLINIFVVSDPKHPENNNKVKILRFGRQLHKIIMEAIEGDDAKEFGERIFDLTATGCNLRIKAEKNEGNYATYVSSKFVSPSEIPGLTSEKIQEIYNTTFDLTKIFTIKSYEELKDMLDQHYYASPNTSTKKDSKKEPVKKVTDKETATEDDVPMEKSPVPSEEVLDDNKVAELLKDLE